MPLCPAPSLSLLGRALKNLPACVELRSEILALAALQEKQHRTARGAKGTGAAGVQKESLLEEAAWGRALRDGRVGGEWREVAGVRL